MKKNSELNKNIFNKKKLELEKGSDEVGNK